ncbi:MAG: EF2563 family selenium-dependent molybdenum hydroxylase system protein [Desulfarculaceae bacterium]|nr:EF2563 family selenium-dependent molybdenum hydroxylase system protein [Desulfarculaceae bacterium]MCF8065477.1 EF2563 family selenium-dependent molybdenum hydroxylase system protein [Desulfarculaceae bacterium]MCF8099288.1 EF2563 family selenium-dependent molybdenum hydroxylase system protein [Desulfarculaceae bacterium]
MRLIEGKLDDKTNKARWDDRAMTGVKVLLRGGGEMASGVAHCLALAGLRVLISELPTPLAVRREVSFCEAVFDGRKTVECVTARRIDEVSQAPTLWQRGELPVLVDPSMECLKRLEPQVIVDALLAKTNTGLHRDMAPLTIGLGPGFKAPEDVHIALETKRGHDLGRLIYQGSPVPNTGIPGNTAGYTHQRVLRAPTDGVFKTDHKLGDLVQAGQTVATVDGQEVVACVGGVLRGLIRPGYSVHRGLKVGDVDPRSEVAYLFSIGEKPRTLGGAVLQAIMVHLRPWTQTRDCQVNLATGGHALPVI